MSPWIEPFLIALGTHGGTLAPAARAVGVEPRTVYAKLANDEEFKARVTEAQEAIYDDMERELARRALEGVEEPVVYQGQLAFRMERAEDDEGNEVWRRRLDEHGQPVPLTVNKKSDALLMFALKGYRKKRFAERTELTGANEGPLAVDDVARAARVDQLLQLARGRAAEPDIGEYA